jgi:hypothetical protein
MESQSTQGHTEVVLKETFYGDKALPYVLLLAFSVLIIAVLFFILSYIFITTPQSKYFLTNTNGQIFLSQPIDKPIYTNAQISDWTAQAVIRAFDFNFINYRHQLYSSRGFFTQNGYQIFIDQMQRLFISNVTLKKFSTKLSLCDIATIDKSVSRAVNIDGITRYVWLITLPVYLQLQNSGESIAIAAKILVKVQRMSDLEYLGGLAIDDIRIIEPMVIQRGNYKNLPVCSNG